MTRRLHPATPPRDGRPPRMSDEEFLLLNEAISSRIGLHFPEHKKEILESRLRRRLETLNLRHFFDYYLLLQLDRGDELAHLARAVSNNETYFFRETDQIEALFGPALEAWRSRPLHVVPLRVLSAGCSSGEEAYTLNIYGNENRLRWGGPRPRVDAFDIDADRVAISRQAEYGSSSLRAVPPERVGRYFRTETEGRYRLRDPHREGVRFFIGNILDLSSFRPALPYDAIFCRNVLIYFSEAAIHRTIENFADALAPGGLLFLGHSESIIGLSSRFETVRFASCLAYRRVG